MEPITLLSAADQVAEHLREALLRGELSGTMPGNLPLAAELGVNHKTVKTALKQLETEGLLVPQGAGRRRRIVVPEHPAKPGLRIAVMLFDRPSQGTDYLIELRHRLETAGHIPFFTEKCLEDLGRDPRRVARYVETIEADAWIVSAGSRDILDWFAQREAATFALFGAWSDRSMAATGPDKAPAITKATQRLIELGHRRISLIGRHEVRLPAPSQSVRAYLDTIEAAGITTGPFNLPAWEESRQGFKDLLNSMFDGPTPPTALILDEAFEFNACYHHLSQKGWKVPQDVSLICTDNDRSFIWCDPAVSHIQWDHRPVVRRVVNWARNVARGKADYRQTLTKAEFVEGGTIGPVAN